MTRTRIISAAIALLAGCLLLVIMAWSPIAEKFGPMKQIDSQCLICHRRRLQKWVCGGQVQDAITTNQYSDWIDTFTPVNHQHVWSGSTHQQRRYWFGSTSIGCGGVPVIPRIFEQRDQLGEQQAQQLVGSFHTLVRGQGTPFDWQAIDEFQQALANEPQTLLRRISPSSPDPSDE